ncbi:MAG: sulfate permease [Betaproteobacteria bacterium]
MSTLKRSLPGWFPIARWLAGYNREFFAADLVAGIVTAILLIPQGLAFSLLAGLPLQVGLYASILPPVAYALFGTSRTLAVGPVSIVSIMVAEALRALPAGTDPVAAAVILALLCGIVLLALGVARLGLLANFLSHPVLSGFTSAAALIIVVSQLPALLGVRWPAGVPLIRMGATIVETVRAINGPTLAIGALSIALLLLSGRPVERVLTSLGVASARARVLTRTAPLILLALTTLLVLGLGLDADAGVAVVGVFSMGTPHFAATWPAWSVVMRLLPSAALIAMVGYVESVSIAKTLANRRRETIDPNQELIAHGVANLAAAVSGAMPVAGGFSRTVVNYNAGARTQMASIITATLVALAAWSIAPVLEHVPKAALAAIIIVASAGLVDVHAARSAWRYDRGDGLVLFATAACVLVFGLDAGLFAGLVLSLLVYIGRASRPHIAELGRVAGSEHFRNVRRYHALETWPPLLLLRVDEHLSFANSAWFEETVMNRVSESPQLRHLILVCGGINGIDTSGLETLIRLAHSLKEAGITLHLAEVKGPVMDRLHRSELLAVMAPGRVFMSAHEAVKALAP